jgi:hypothetical protein
MGKIFSARGILLDGMHLEQRFRDRGFIDIKVIRKDLYFGDYKASMGVISNANFSARDTSVWSGRTTCLWIRVERLNWPDESRMARAGAERRHEAESGCGLEQPEIPLPNSNLYEVMMLLTLATWSLDAGPRALTNDRTNLVA